MNKQKELKIIIFGLLILLADYMQASLYKSGNMIYAIEGVKYNSRIYLYMLQFFIFVCYCLYMQSEFENHVYGGGIYRLIRSGRLRLFGRLSVRLAGILFTIGVVRFVGYAIISFMMTGSVYIENVSLFIYLLLINFLIYYVIFFFQMVLELRFSGRIALYITMMYYLFSIFLGDCLDLAENPIPWLQFLFLPNIAMRLRWEKLCSLFFHDGVEIIVVLVMLVVSFLICNKWFHKKDII